MCGYVCVWGAIVDVYVGGGEPCTCHECLWSWRNTSGISPHLCPVRGREKRREGGREGERDLIITTAHMRPAAIGPRVFPVLFIWCSVPHWLGTCPIGWAGYPANPKDLPVSASVRITSLDHMPSLFLRWVLGLELRSINALSTEPRSKLIIFNSGSRTKHWMKRFQKDF